MRIAMWSGPRNLSTAMMYSFGARSDCAVVDEPFYAAYLAMTGLDHPLRDEILTAQDNDPGAVAAALTRPIPGGRQHFYQKHMTQHMVPGIPRGWMADVVNVFLIRHPARVLASYAAKRENPTLEDIGFVQQLELFEHAVALGKTAVVIDSADIRADPEGMLRKLCDAIGLGFEPSMLHWSQGGHAQDGVWAAHWYGAVHRSTGFAGAEGKPPTMNGQESALAEKAMMAYRRLESFKI